MGDPDPLAFFWCQTTGPGHNGLDTFARGPFGSVKSIACRPFGLLKAALHAGRSPRMCGQNPCKRQTRVRRMRLFTTQPQWLLVYGAMVSPSFPPARPPIFQTNFVRLINLFSSPTLFLYIFLWMQRFRKPTPNHGYLIPLLSVYTP